MDELPGALLGLGILLVGVVAVLVQPRGLRAATVLAERPLTWIAPVLLALLLAWITRQAMVRLDLIPDLQGIRALRRNLTVGSLGLVESLLPLVVLSGQLGWIRQALGDRAVTPQGFVGGVRANFPALLMITVALAVVGILLESITPLIWKSWVRAGWGVAGVVVLFANVEVFALAGLMGAGPAAVPDLFPRVERMSRESKYEAAAPVVFHLLGLGLLTIFPWAPSPAATGAWTDRGMQVGFHATSVFDYGFAAHWFSDLTREAAPLNEARQLLRLLMGALVGMFSVLMLAIHMQVQVPAGTTPAPTPAPEPRPAPEPAPAAVASAALPPTAPRAAAPPKAAAVAAAAASDPSHARRKKRRRKH